MRSDPGRRPPPITRAPSPAARRRQTTWERPDRSASKSSRQGGVGWTRNAQIGSSGASAPGGAVDGGVSRCWCVVPARWNERAFGSASQQSAIAQRCRPWRCVMRGPWGTRSLRRERGGAVCDPEFGRSASLGSSTRSPSGSAQRAGEQDRVSFRWCDQLSRLRTRPLRQSRSRLTWQNVFRRPAPTANSTRIHKRSRHAEGTTIVTDTVDMPSDQAFSGADDGNRTRVFSLGS